MPKVGILHSGTEGKHNPHIDALGLKPGDIVGGNLFMRMMTPRNWILTPIIC